MALTTKINQLPAAWRKEFCRFSRDENDYIHMDERLVIPKALRLVISGSLRDSMLATVVNVWWPPLHWQVVRLAKHCQQCQAAGKNVKPMLRQKERGHVPKCTKKIRKQQLSY